MGPLSKLLVMVEQMNSDSNSSSTVEMNPVLEILDKIVLLIGQFFLTVQSLRLFVIFLNIFQFNIFELFPAYVLIPEQDLLWANCASFKAV